jgi:hypothetical protein
MLTASNKTTKQAQEILASAQGGLLVSQEECRSYRVSASQTIPTGPCRLVGVVLVSSMEASTVLLECSTNQILKLRSPAGWSQSAFLPLPLACPANLEITMTGNGAEAYVYVMDAS